MFFQKNENLGKIVSNVVCDETTADAGRTAADAIILSKFNLDHKTMSLPTTRHTTQKTIAPIATNLSMDAKIHFDVSRT